MTGWVKTIRVRYRTIRSLKWDIATRLAECLPDASRRVGSD